MSLQDLEKRLQVLEDIEEIKKLKARYCAYCDDNYNADNIASLFAENAVRDGGAYGRAEGREEIRKFFNISADQVSFSVHLYVNPIIEVDGDTATGRWYMFEAITAVAGNQAQWGSGLGYDEYVRVNGEWKFKSMKLKHFFLTPFDQGWVKHRFVAMELPGKATS